MKRTAEEYEEGLKKMGVDPVEFVFAVMMESMFVDIAHSWSFHLEGLLKKTDHYNGRNKQLIKRIKDLLEEFSKTTSHSLGREETKEIQEQVQIGYGDRCDFVRDCSMLLTQIPVEDRIKVISSLKLFIKK